MTLAESVIRLVQRGPRALPADADDSPLPYDEAGAAPAAAAIAPRASASISAAGAGVPVPDGQISLPGHESGFTDLEAAVSLVSTGLARRVVLTGFPSWPGLLWKAYRLADASGVQILPTVVRPGGRVDLVVEADACQRGGPNGGPNGGASGGPG